MNKHFHSLIKAFSSQTFYWLQTLLIFTTWFGFLPFAHADVNTRLINISTRASIEGGVGNIIAGFVIQGQGTQTVLIKGVGLIQGVDPYLAVRKFPSGELIAENNNWQDSSRFQEILALSKNLQLQNVTDAGLLLDLPAGAYTATLSTVGKKGLGLIGVNAIGDPSKSPTQLINISTRALIQGGANNIIAGFIITGTGQQKVLIKATRLAPNIDSYIKLQKYPSGEVLTTNDDMLSGLG